MIPFSKVSDTPFPFRVAKEGVSMEGTLVQHGGGLLRLEARLHGTLSVKCFRCGETFELPLDEAVAFLLSDGIFHGRDDAYDVVEVEKSMVDLDEVFHSETAMIQCDYHACPACQTE